MLVEEEEEEEAGAIEVEGLVVEVRRRYPRP
jgi:hypothetical protein